MASFRTLGAQFWSLRACTLAIVLFALQATGAPAPGALANLGEYLEPGRSLPLPESQYVSAKAQRLSNAKIQWVNFEYFKSVGIDLGSELTPEVERALLRTFAWGIPSGNDPSNAFTSEAREVYADYYGGYGRGGNLGSGRAASFLGKRRVQAKGLGRTPLTTIPLGQSHSNGAVPTTEGIREAIFSEINHFSLPHGGNRVLLVLDRGTKSEYTYGVHSDSIIIREDPIRPAHFEVLDNPELKSTSFERESLTSLERALPIPEESKKKSREERIIDGVKNFVKRLAQQHATAFFGARLYHGAHSESNVEISGRFLDYGTQTGNIGHAEAQILDHIEGAGKTQQLKDLNVIAFRNELLERFPNLKGHMPSPSGLTDLFDRHYARTARIEMLRSLGYPEEFCVSALNAPEGRLLSEMLVELAQSGAKAYSARKQPEAKVIRNNMLGVAQSLFEGRMGTSATMEKGLRKVIRESGDRVLIPRLISSFLAVQERAVAWAEKKGIGSGEWALFQADLIWERNREITKILRWNMIDEAIQIVDRYKVTQDTKEIQKYIDQAIRLGQRGTEHFYVGRGTVRLSVTSPLRRTPCRRLF